MRLLLVSLSTIHITIVFTCRIGISHPFLLPVVFLPPVVEKVGFAGVADEIRRYWLLRIHLVGYQAQGLDPRLLRDLQAVVGNATVGEIGLEHVEFSDKQQALYNLFAAYIHTIPLEELIESVERARLDAQLRYVVIYGATFIYVISQRTDRHTLTAHPPNTSYTHHKRVPAADVCSASNQLRSRRAPTTNKQ